MIDLIKEFVFTAASINRVELNQYTFNVDKRATKTEIKLFIENYYNIKVIRVNTYRPPAKKTRIGKYTGLSSSFKRAIVTVKKGQNLKRAVI